MLYSIFVIAVVLIVAPACFFFGFRIGRILGRAEEGGKKEKVVDFKIKTKEERAEEKRRKEQRIKEEKQLQNILNYDGTSKGQVKL